MPLGNALGIVTPLAEGLAASMAYTLVEVEWAKEGQDHYLRIYIDKPGGITLDDCEAYHRAIQPKLEHIEYDFLEISSPGLDRPLKKPEDYTRAAGQEIELSLFQKRHGAKRHMGRLSGLADGVVTLETAAGNLSFSLKDIALAKPVIRFEEVNGEQDEEQDGGNDCEP